MPTFPATRAPPAKPAIHLQGSRDAATTHLAVRVQAGFEEITAPSFPPTDLCLQAIDRLAEEFKPQVLIAKLVCIFAGRAQAILNAIEDVKDFRSLDTATGQQLDELGKLYRAHRNAKTDDAYRAFLKGFAIVVGTHGFGDEMLAALIALDNGFDLSSITLVEHHPAGFVITAKVPFGQQLLGEEHASVLRRMVPGGVRFMLLFEEVGVDLFVWSGDAGEGWAEEGAPGSGGLWAEGV